MLLEFVYSTIYNYDESISYTQQNQFIMETNFKTTKISSRASLYCKELNRNKLVLIETDTILSISCLIKPGPVSRLYQIKQRRDNRPFLIAAKHIEHLAPHININALSEEEFDLINRVTEEPISYIVPANKDSYLYRFGDDVGIRLIRKGIFAEVTTALEQGLITTSCNISGQKPINNPLRVVQEISRELVLSGPYADIPEDTPPSKVYHVKNKIWIR